MAFPILVFIGMILGCAGVIRQMIRVGVMDVPGHRSSHTRPIPKGGGIGIMTAFVIGLPVLRLSLGLTPLSVPLGLTLGGVVLLAVFSWFDDIYSFPAVHKLSAQAVAALLVLLGADGFHGGALGWVLEGLGFIWLLYVTNALNFIDGLNGLASGTMALSAAMAAFALFYGHDAEHGWTLAALAVCLMTFLPFNFPRAAIFMGDVGSQGAGLMMGWAGLVCAVSLHDFLLMPVLLFGVLYDVAFTLIRRAFAGDSLMQAHRGHLYQIAARTGVPAATITLTHWGFAAWGAFLDRAVTIPVVIVAGALLPQILWTAFVVRRARRCDIGRW
ncbi:MraY family glycosyltransferase [Kozakia baliensis]|uniref:hypothetical protein n=1 Tax=Kozakia baliensis TaxID=153496 RepID=UPI00087AC013|nr:hypothetical protein [Kozakia baliensis]AOX19366.1 hypothetical protein A0U90_02615 [Kozakia baliensis]